MASLFVYQDYPAQFGHIADHPARHRGFRCHFVSQTPARRAGAIEYIRYRHRGGATKSSSSSPTRRASATAATGP